MGKKKYSSKVCPYHWISCVLRVSFFRAVGAILLTLAKKEIYVFLVQYFRSGTEVKHRLTG